jgi:LuxR family maltose regulon positive regulatory protein
MMPRNDLVRQVLAAPPGSCVVVSAPAGYGGSTLLDLVAAAAAGTVLQVRAHRPEGDCDLAGALARVLGADPAGGPAGLRRALALRGEVLLLIDDVADGCDGGCESVLAALLVEPMPLVRVVVRTLRTLRVDLSRLLARGLLVLLGPDQLLFTEEESLAFLAARMPGEDPDRMRALATAGGGWAGAMTAALSAAAGPWRSDPAGWLMGPGLELLLGPLVDDLPVAERELLVGCSVLEVLEPELCDTVLRREDSAQVLDQLAHRLLVLAVPGRPRAWAPHQLLGELARRRLARRGRSALAAAHQAAAQGLAEAGDVDAAIFQLIEAGDVGAARQLLAEHVGGLMERGRSDRVRLLYRRTPELLVDGEHLHLLAEAWAGLLSGDTAPTERDLRLLESALPPADEPLKDAAEEWLVAETHLLRSYLNAWRGRLGPALADLDAALELYQGRWERSGQQLAPLLRIRFDLWCGDRAHARESLLAVSTRARTGQYYLEVTIPALGAVLAAEEGRAYRAQHLSQQALATLARTGRFGSIDEGDALLARSRAGSDLGEFEQAADDAERLLHRAQEIGHVAYEVLARAASARAGAGLLRFEEAADQLARARRLLRSHAAGPGLLPALDVASVDLAIGAGDREGAEAAMARLPLDRRGSCALRVAGLDPRLSEATAARLLHTYPPRDPRTVVDGRLLLAAAHLGSRPDLSRRHLADAAAVAVDHGLLRALVGCSDELLALAAAGALSGDPLGTLLQSARRSAAPRAAATAPLSAGELELLDHLADPVGNREIADRLGITVNTLKTRLRRLYAKLGVHDRVSAVQAAGADRHRGRGS